MDGLVELKNYLEERTLIWPEMYFHNGLLEGKSEGKAEGKAEGMLEDQSTILINQLIDRFGSLPDKIISRIKSDN